MVQIGLAMWSSKNSVSKLKSFEKTSNKIFNFTRIHIWCDFIFRHKKRFELYIRFEPVEIKKLCKKSWECTFEIKMECLYFLAKVFLK